MDKIRKWLRSSFPHLYKRFGRYFHTHRGLRRRVLRDAGRHPDRYADPEMRVALEYLKRETYSVFSFPGYEKYATLEVDVRVDDDGFPWVDHGGRRLYFRRGTAVGSVANCYRALCREQDAASPHCYRAEGFGLCDGGTFIDVGSAEGIYALDNVERAARVVLLESDPAWVGALERTFAPWQDKVTVVNKWASDTDSTDGVTLDAVVREHRLDGPLLLKMDVEGAEACVLAGAREALSRPDTRAVICTYHRDGDYERLSEDMRSRGFRVATSRGWMLLLGDKKGLRPPFFRRGVIYCTRAAACADAPKN